MYIYKEEMEIASTFHKLIGLPAEINQSMHFLICMHSLTVCISLYKINIGDKFMVKNIQT